ncbi:PREDICTED: smad nuclear-interacting protein 1-like [Branchiostoma belcheri]|uniref:Smad nuclear-interacting protein 1-like n=1 Tax=Branchiostoma belcheri TaxID=7741 RepID=A0A6P4YJT8_BRABE|nr:PREDICTED: smad nuclear-interacting protein 1-like [Branchiostoma belcheri]
MPAEEQGKRTRDREKDRNFQTNMAEKEHYSSRRRSPLVEKKSKDSQRRREEERLDRRHTDRTEQRSRSPARNRGEDSRDRGRERSRERERRRDRSRERDHRRVDRGVREGERGGRQQHRRRDEREREERKFVRVKEERDRNDERRREDKQRKPENPFQTEEGTEGGEEEEANKDQPNFELSGALTEETNKFRGVVIKYREPPEARKPRKRWRLYPFKGEEALKPLHIHRQSAYLLGRERLVADIPIDHPSCSKQHAALQYRLVDYEKPDGTTGRRVKPYIIDLESANGTYVNNQRIEASRYVELMEKDVVKFGYSSREYVLLHDTSDTSGVQAGEDDEGLDD